jgi:hypothetical protein
MARPVYILCSQSGTEDKHTGMISHFNVLEMALISPIPAQEPGKPIIIVSQPIQIVAVWMRDDGDIDREFEFELYLLIPPKMTRFDLGKGTFSFTKFRHRFTVNIQGQPPLEGCGEMSAVSRIRPVGSDAWITQEYPIIIGSAESEKQSNGKPT